MIVTPPLSQGIIERNEPVMLLTPSRGRNEIRSGSKNGLVPSMEISVDGSVLTPSLTNSSSHQRSLSPSMHALPVSHSFHLSQTNPNIPIFTTPSRTRRNAQALSTFDTPTSAAATALVEEMNDDTSMMETGLHNFLNWMTPRRLAHAAKERKAEGRDEQQRNSGRKMRRRGAEEMDYAENENDVSMANEHKGGDEMHQHQVRLSDLEREEMGGADVQHEDGGEEEGYDEDGSEYEEDDSSMDKEERAMLYPLLKERNGSDSPYRTSHVIITSRGKDGSGRSRNTMEEDFIVGEEFDSKVGDADSPSVRRKRKRKKKKKPLQKDLDNDDLANQKDSNKEDTVTDV